MLLPIIERIGWPLAVLGLGLKYLLFPAGNALLILAIGALADVYFLQAFAPIAFPPTTSFPEPHSADEQDDHSSMPGEKTSFLVDALLPKLAGIGGAVVLVGTLFKLMNWHGEAQMLLAGTVTLLVTVVVTALHQRRNLRALVLTVRGGLMLYVPSETLIRQLHRDDPALVEKMIYQHQHPRDRAAAEAVRQYLRQKND